MQHRQDFLGDRSQGHIVLYLGHGRLPIPTKGHNEEVVLLGQPELLVTSCYDLLATIEVICEDQAGHIRDCLACCIGARLPRLRAVLHPRSIVGRPPRRVPSSLEARTFRKDIEQVQHVSF